MIEVYGFGGEMSNIIYYKEDPEVIGMGNGLTSSFINVIGLSGSKLAVKYYEKNLIIFLLEKDQSNVGIGTVGFDICTMPWNKNVFQEQKQFLLKVCENVLQKDEWDKLDYIPNYEIISHCIRGFANLLKKMKTEDIDEIESEEWLKEFENERSNENKYPVCKIHNALLTCFGCQICNE